MPREYLLSHALKLLITNALTELPESKHADFFDDTRNIIAHYHGQILKTPIGVRRAMTVLAFVEELLLSQEKSRVASCKVGCSHCCHVSVLVSKSEAIMLAEHVRLANHELDRELLSRQAAFSGDDGEWWKLPKSENACVFLKDNKCSVYEIRPVNCRKYFVASPPEHCETTDDDRRLVKVIASLQVELFATAAMDAERDFATPLPKALARELQ